MSQINAKRVGLNELLARRTFIVFVSLEQNMNILRSGETSGWTIPKLAQPGDRLIVYKPGAAAGWPGGTRDPYEAFVAAGIVYGKPRLRGTLYSAP